MSTVFRILLLIGLLVCAVATALVKKPMRAVIIYMAYSIIMSVVWLNLRIWPSPRPPWAQASRAFCFS